MARGQKLRTAPTATLRLSVHVAKRVQRTLSSGVSESRKTHLHIVNFIHYMLALWPATNTTSITFTIGYLWYHTTLNIVAQYYSYYNISTHQKNSNLVIFGWMLEDRIFPEFSTEYNYSPWKCDASKWRLGYPPWAYRLKYTTRGLPPRAFRP